MEGGVVNLFELKALPSSSSPSIYCMYNLSTETSYCRRHNCFLYPWGLGFLYFFFFYVITSRSYVWGAGDRASSNFNLILFYLHYWHLSTALIWSMEFQQVRTQELQADGIMMRTWLFCCKKGTRIRERHFSRIQYEIPNLHEERSGKQRRGWSKDLPRSLQFPRKLVVALSDLKGEKQDGRWIGEKKAKSWKRIQSRSSCGYSPS